MPRRIDQFPKLAADAISSDDILLIEKGDGSNTYYHVTVADLLAISGETTEPTPTPVQFPIASRLNFSASDLKDLADNSLVDSTADTSGNNFTAIATGSTRPTFKKNILNGKPGLYFSGSNWMDWGSKQIIPAVDNFAIIQVIAYEAYGEICGFGSGGTSGDNWGLQIRGNAHYSVSNGTLRECDFPDPPINIAHISVYGRFNSQWRSYVNGTTTTGASGDTHPIRGSSNNYQAKTVLGAFWNNSQATRFLKGYIFDTCVLIAPTIDNLNSVGNYYKNFYNIIWNNVS